MPLRRASASTKIDSKGADSASSSKLKTASPTGRPPIEAPIIAPPASLACEGAVVECRVTPSDDLVDGTAVTAMVEMDGPFSGDADCEGLAS